MLNRTVKGRNQCPQLYKHIRNNLKKVEKAFLLIEIYQRLPFHKIELLRKFLKAGSFTFDSNCNTDNSLYV